MVKAPMSKDLLMKYTAISLFFIAFLSYFVFGLISVIVVLVSVGVAVGCDVLLGKLMGSGNMMSAIVFGFIVGLSYSLGQPLMALENIPGMVEGLEQVIYPALISALGLIVFKRLQGLSGRKYVNPAAIAKLIVLGLLFLPAFSNVSALLPSDHDSSIPLTNPLTADAFGGPDFYPMDTAPLGATLITCYADQNQIMMGNMYNFGSYEEPLLDVAFTMLFAKYHGWVGGFSSILVIAIGLALFFAARTYIKWRITLFYLITMAVLSLIFGFIYGGDPILRMMFHLFAGSSIFMAFFMATDPATTPITNKGQIIFGVGLAILTILIQTYIGFLGGSILALVIMNLTSPILDNVGITRPGKKDVEPKLPANKNLGSVPTYDCVRCGGCMTVCVNGLSPILIKQALEKKDANKLMKLHAEYCAGCGNCNLICPARIHLEACTLGYNLTEEEAKEIEKQFLTGKADENLGIYSDVFAAKTSIKGQDGGVATGVLVSGMKRNLFDAAIVVKRIDGYLADSIVAETADELLKAKGTKYVRVSMMSKIGDLLKKGKRKIAIVGTACQIRAARRLQQILINKYPDLELTLIGLFCYEIFDYKKLKEETKRLLDINLDEAERTQIEKGKYIVTVNGKDHSVKVKELSEAVEERCLACPDFTSMYSDISVGSVGSAEGYSTVIVRSEIGENLLTKLDLTKGTVKKDEITQLCIRKKERATKNLAKSGY